MFYKIFLVCSFFDVCKLQEFFPVLAKLFIHKLLILLSLLGIFFDQAVLRSLREKFASPLVKSFLFFFSWMFISLPFAIYPGNSLFFITEAFWKTAVTFFLILAYSSSINRIENIITAYIFGTILLCVSNIMAQGPGRVDLIGSYDANELALVLVVFFPFLFWKSLKLSGVKRIFSLIGCGIVLISLIKTGSRGGFLGFSFTILVILFQLRGMGRKYFNYGLIGIVLLITVFLIVADQAFINRLSTIVNYKQDYNTTSQYGRLEIWNKGLKMLWENPVFGVGLNNFLFAEGQTHYHEGGKWSAAHNAFIQVGGELGIPGLLCFCWMILYSILKLRSIQGQTNQYSTNVNPKLLSRSIIASFVGFIISGSFLSVAYDLLYIQLIALSASLLFLYQQLSYSSSPHVS